MGSYLLLGLEANLNSIILLKKPQLQYNPLMQSRRVLECGITSPLGDVVLSAIRLGTVASS